MQEIDTPIRITWAVGGQDSPFTATELRSIAQEIADGGALFVTVTNDPLQHAGIASALEVMTSSGCQVTVVTRSVRGLSAGMHLHHLAMDVTSIGTADQKVIKDDIAAARDMGYEPMFLFVPMKEYLSDIPDLFRLAMELNVGRIKLSNVPINASYGRIDAPDIPRPQDVQKLVPTLQEAAGSIAGKVTLEIHDRFLWEVLSGDSSSLVEYGGCQAANSLAYVDTKGNIHPCDSWLSTLGNLRDSTLEDIWASSPRKSVRDEISGTPVGCQGCGDYNECFGGCRGLSASFEFSNQGRDPLCDGRR